MPLNVKSPSVTQRSVFQENTLFKQKKQSLFFPPNYKLNSWILIENNLSFFYESEDLIQGNSALSFTKNKNKKKKKKKTLSYDPLRGLCLIYFNRPFMVFFFVLFCFSFCFCFCFCFCLNFISSFFFLLFLFFVCVVCFVLFCFIFYY